MGMSKRTILYFIIGLLFVFIFFIILAFYTKFDPDDVSSLNVFNNQVGIVELEDTISLLTYNIGHGGLDSDWDSYSYGGREARAKSHNQVEENLQSMIQIIDDVNPDIFLLQGLDTNSRRSYYTDQLGFFNEKYPNYSYVFAKNKDIRFLPLPIHKPVGRIQSGIATFSKYSTIEGLRFSLPSNGNLLTNIFEYKWAITKTKYETDFDSDLVVINVKLSPYGEGDFIREEQLNFLKLLLEEEYEKGNYLLVGGDYSHNLPGVDPFNFRYSEEWPTWLKNIPDDYQVGNFSWEIDESQPSFRNLSKPFKLGKNFVAITDGFLVSDNIEVKDVITINNGFQHSNHNPVTIRFTLKP